MRLFFLKGYLVLIVFSITNLCYGQTNLTLKKGKVIDSITIPSLNNHFSLYLPRSFDMNKKWPVILGFDSSGNSKAITELYKNAAEEYGYVVAVSNFSENYDAKERLNHASFFLNYMFSIFPFQKDRIYVTGMGDDARLVSLLPVFFEDDIYGIVTIDNSYFYNSSIKIKKNCSHIGIVNTTNYRYKDFLNNRKYLGQKAIPADVLSYEEESMFPNQELIKKALSTFTLQAMLKGRVPMDSVWVENTFQNDLKHVETYLGAKKFVYAMDEVKRIRHKYRLFFDTSYLKEKQKEIRKLKEYKFEKRLHTKYANRENFLRFTYSFSIQEDIDGENYGNLGWWKYQVSELDSWIQSDEKYERHMAHRVKGYLQYLVTGYRDLQPKGGKNFEKKMFLNILATIVDKRDFDAYLEIISMSTEDQDFQTSLFYLEELLKNGYKDFDALYNIEGTLALRMSKEYNELVKKYLGESKYFFSN